MNQKKANTVRIIAGKWRGRRLPVANIEGLRPTSDRVRETLFNWLQTDIVDAVCLDLFAGSGALGFEAVSRGAKKIVMVDRAREVTVKLQESARILQADNVEITHADVGHHWPMFKEKFTLVFLDPPYQSDLLPHAFQGLTHCLMPGALIYVETHKQQQLPALPDTWEMLKFKQAGQVAYYLLRAS